MPNKPKSQSVSEHDSGLQLVDEIKRDHQNLERIVGEMEQDVGEIQQIVKAAYKDIFEIDRGLAVNAVEFIRDMKAADRQDAEDDLQGPESAPQGAS